MREIYNDSDQEKVREVHSDLDQEKEHDMHIDLDLEKGRGIYIGLDWEMLREIHGLETEKAAPASAPATDNRGLGVEEKKPLVLSIYVHP